MAQRTPDRQSEHDKKVKEIVEDYKSRYWDTKADLLNHEKPDTIYGHIPDVQAKLDKWEEIVEVETPETVGKDKDQHRAFQRYAEEKPNTQFKVVIAD